MVNYSYIYYFKMYVSPVGVFLCQQDSQITTQNLLILIVNDRSGLLLADSYI